MNNNNNIWMICYNKKNQSLLLRFFFGKREDAEKTAENLSTNSNTKFYVEDGRETWEFFKD